MTNKHIDPWELLHNTHKVFGAIETVAADSYECDCPPEWQRCGACRIKQHSRSAQRDIDAALAEHAHSATPVVGSSLVVGSLEWQAKVPEESFTWQEAKVYAESLGNDWRLPTRAELLTLVDDTQHNPACSVFPDCPAEWFWTSSPWAGFSSNAWYVHFSGGSAYNSGVGNAYRVRCVRDVAKEGG